MKSSIILVIILALSGCAGLGNLCEVANGYTITDARTGQSVIVAPAKCAVLKGI